MKYDAIIIGAGLGGLFAGAKLAKEGIKVLLVEQHDRPGGCATNFKRKEFTMEVGLHEMDGLHSTDVKTRMFRDLGIFDKVKFLKVPEFYRFINGRYDLIISHDPKETQQTLIKKFPAEEAGIIAYFNRILNIRKILKEEVNLPERNVGEFMDSIIGNEDLKLILLGNLGYYLDNPYKLSLNYYCTAQNSYYSGGGNFIQGGSQVLSDYLVSFVLKNGGTVLLNHLVKEIVLDEDKALGIRFQSVAKNNSTVKTAYAKEIIANTSIPQVASQLLPKKFGQIVLKEIVDFETSPSLLTVYFGFNKKLNEIGFKNYSVFVFDDSIHKLADIESNNHADFDKRSFTFVDYSQIDSKLAPDGKAVGSVCCNDYAVDWEKLDKKEYRRRKEKVARHFINRLEKIIPGFKEAVEYYEVGTAKTVQRYTLNPGGAVYGFAQTQKRVKKVIKSPVRNLCFASAWSRTGGGYSGAIYSGYLCAQDIVRKWR